MKHWKWMQIVGWLGVIVGLSGIIPGLFLLRGSMIELGLIILLLAVGVLWQAAALDELRATRAALSRLVLLVERMNSSDTPKIPNYRVVPGDVPGSYGMVPEEENDAVTTKR